jgi:hypothetical protein
MHDYRKNWDQKTLTILIITWKIKTYNLIN